MIVRQTERGPSVIRFGMDIGAIGYDDQEIKQII